jgi:hypothetical protein
MISKAYFILGYRYLRYDATADAMDAGYPKAIEGNWRGFAEIGFQSGIDAALEWPNGKVFFFKGPQYARYDIAPNRIEAGYPLQIADQWTGLSTAGLADNIDAAVKWGNDKAYFFKGDRYLRYDIAGDKADDGFPRRITDGWPGFENAAFDANINTVVNWGNGKAYFFHDDRYLRYDITGDRIDEGYPQSIASGWPTVAAAGFGASIGAGWTVHGAASAHSSDFYYLSGQFFVQLKRVCQRLHCAPEDLLGVMESESGVRPDAQNPNGKATGLIQFMPSTLTSLGWSKGPDGFRSLNADQQLPFVEKSHFRRPAVSSDLSPCDAARFERIDCDRGARRA